jgi:spermidine synthase
MAPRIAVAAGFLLLSGATGLMYEVVWSKALADWLGNSGQAHALVLATFMGGLALGAWVFGSMADRSARPLLVYGLIEIGIGLAALAFPTIQGLARGGFLRVAAQTPEAYRLVPKLVFAAVSVLAPAIAMGGTMPVMLSHIGRRPESGDSVATLYSLNSLGAAIGAWLAGTVLLPNAGVWATSRAAGMVNLFIGATAVTLGWRDRSAYASRPEGTSSHVTSAVSHVAFWAMGLSGFTTMALETGWIRAVTLMVGGSTYAFTCIVTAFITGLALGSGWVARLPPKDPVQFFLRCQLALVATVALTVPICLRLPYLFLRARDVLARTTDAFGLYQSLLFAVCAAVVLGPTLVLGAAFPVGARLATGGDTSGRSLGRVWAFNTVGTVLGALCSGLFLMPALGLSALLWVGVALTLAIATRLVQVTRLSPWGVVAALAAWLALGASSPEWATVLTRLSPFRVSPQTARGKTSEAYMRTEMASASELFVRHDTFASVFVGQSTTDANHRFLLVNGKPDASTLPMDMVTQTLIGQLGPLLSRREVKRGMVIGVGAGFTVGSLLTHGLNQLDVVEISPAVVEASRHFDAENNQALADPRVQLHIDDARTTLSLASGKYDLIVSEPSNPWVSGISSLFTDAFFEISKSKLTDDGLLIQWIHTYEMSDALVRLVLRTLLAHFPHVTAWQGGMHDVILVASRQPLPLSFDELTSRIGAEAVARDLRRIHIDGPLGLLALQRTGTDSLRTYAGAGPLNTDEHNRLEFGAPIAFYVDAQAEIPDDRRRPTRHQSLYFSQVLLKPLKPAQAREITRAVAAAQGDDDPVGRSAAQSWYAVAPDSVARFALAEFAYEQREVSTTLKLLSAPREDREASLTIRALTLDWRNRASVLAPLPEVDLAPLIQWLPDAGGLCQAIRCIGQTTESEFPSNFETDAGP